MTNAQTLPFACQSLLFNMLSRLPPRLFWSSSVSCRLFTTAVGSLPGNQAPGIADYGVLAAYQTPGRLDETKVYCDVYPICMYERVALVVY